MSKIKQTVILAGGLGTRLKPFTDNFPKPMYPIHDIPFIDYLIKQVEDLGHEEVILLLGYKAESVIEYLDKQNYNINVIYDITPVEYDTLERLKNVKDKLQDNFMLMYCDNYCEINYHELEDNFFKHECLAELSLYINDDNYTKSNIRLNEENQVVLYDKKREATDLIGVEIGYTLYSKKIFDLITDEDKSISSHLFPKIIKENQMYVTKVNQRYYSIGSLERINLTNEFFTNKKVAFIDRDGTINVKAPKACYIEKPEQFVFLENAKEAIKLLNDNDYITVLITNQPGIARGCMTYEDLDSIHEKMNKELNEIGAHIDHIYMCTHNWDDGCFCRKPNPGMIYKAQKELSINLKNSILFGDDERDIEAANRANIKSIMVSEEYPLYQAVKDTIERSN